MNNSEISSRQKVLHNGVEISLGPDVTQGLYKFDEYSFIVKRPLRMVLFLAYVRYGRGHFPGKGEL